MHACTTNAWNLLPNKRLRRRKWTQSIIKCTKSNYIAPHRFSRSFILLHHAQRTAHTRSHNFTHQSSLPSINNAWRRQMMCISFSISFFSLSISTRTMYTHWVCALVAHRACACVWVSVALCLLRTEAGMCKSLYCISNHTSVVFAFSISFSLHLFKFVFTFRRWGKISISSFFSLLFRSIMYCFWRRAGTTFLFPIV